MKCDRRRKRSQASQKIWEQRVRDLAYTIGSIIVGYGLSLL